MKINLPVTQQEQVLTDSDSLISTTSLKGIITYANKDFIEISGFPEQELLGKNHNMVRHPDMPVEAFQDLWDTVKSGKPWMGIVKNRCKNGDFYWVDAYVTPIYEKGEITGYQSVRVKPSAEQVARAEALYAKLRNNNKRRFSIPSFSLPMQLLLTLTLLFVVLFAGLLTLDQISITGVFTSLPAFALAYLLLLGIFRPLRQVISESRKVIDNPVTQEIYIGSTQATQAPLLAIRMLQARLRTVLGRMTDASNDIAEMAGKVTASTEKTTEAIHNQKNETDMVTSAMKEMSISVQNISESIHEAAGKAREAHDSSDNGLKQMSLIIQSIDQLSEKLANASSALNLLEQKSDGIGMVLDVIKSIAEQTNLLALNAAIEAARAGDQGRGFAVVADEVRSLAQRTQQSTEEIAKMIPELQAGTQEASRAMDECCKLAASSVEQANAGSQSLDIIANHVNVIDMMNEQIAAATEEQSSVSEEIKRNLVIIGELADESATNSNYTLEANRNLLNITNKFDGMTRQFSP